MYESSLLTRVGTHIPWPGHMIYRVHTAASSSVVSGPQQCLHRLRYHDARGNQRRSVREETRRQAKRWGMTLFISDANRSSGSSSSGGGRRGGKVLYTMRRIRRNGNTRKSMMTWVSSLCSFFKSCVREHNHDDDNNNNNDDSVGCERQRCAEVIEEIGVWKGASTTGRPYLVLSGSLNDMSFDILTSTNTTSPRRPHQQEDGERANRKRRKRRSIVGVVSKHLFDMDSKLHDVGRYGVYVQAGYDCALFVLLAMIVDELFHNDDDDDDVSVMAARRDETVSGGGMGSEPGCDGRVIGKKEREQGGGSLTSGDDDVGGGEEVEGKSLSALLTALGLRHRIVGSWRSHAGSFNELADAEDIIREKAVMLEEHLTDSSDTGV